MDSFTEDLLSRARERQRLLENYNETNEDRRFEKKGSLSQPNLNQASPKKLLHNCKSSSDGKLSSDNVRVEVQIEEDCEEAPETQKNSGGLRNDARNRLNRLGKLYAGGEDANISSPIHQTEGKFHAEDSPKISESEQTKMKRGISKLADLAHTINNFEDDLTSVRKEKDENTRKMKQTRKPPAPQPPEQRASPMKPSNKQPAPQPPTVVEGNQKRNVKIQWDKKVLDSLESQGFSRTESSTRLVYKYGKNEKENATTTDHKKPLEKVESCQNSPQKHTSSRTVADKAAIFESPQNRNTKDPALLSVSERKALFERNKGTPLIPKAPFAMATPPVKAAEPVKNINHQAKRVQAPQSTEANAMKVGGIANTVAALFEQKNTISQQQIEKNVQEQRKQEMDMLLNRFQRPVEIVDQEADYDESDDEETAMIQHKSTEIVAAASSREDRRSGGNKRCSKADSPKVAAVLNDVKRIKVSPQKAGRLYPSLTDIESVTETENDETRSPTPTGNSSSENSFAESDDANTSFGRDILRAVCKNQTPQSNIVEESTSDLSDVLDDMDDYIDEALAYNERQNDGPTPPKQSRKSPIESSHSFHYKSFQTDDTDEFKSPLKKPKPVASVKKNTEELPTHVIDGDNVLPLTHTVSFYRKQQCQASTTPVRQISRQPLIEESSETPPDNEQEEIVAKINEIRNEILKQELIISQTSQALNLCNSTLEFMGSTEQVEAERVLLVATHRRQVAMHEKQRLEVERTLRPKRNGSECVLVQQGSLAISKIVLPLKQKYVKALAAAGGKGHHVVCLLKYDDQVVPTQLVSTIASNTKNPDLELNVPGTISLRNVYSDFTVTFEVYCLQAQEEILPHEIKYHIKKSGTKLTPKKSKQDSRLIRPAKESPAGPQAVRSPTFALMGYVVFSMATIHKKYWSLNNTPSMSPLEGTVEMSIACEMAVTIEHRGFLTMFDDVSGFGAWHRRWCLLNGDTMSYWKYPDDEKKMAPINSINIRDAITKQVGPVSRDICARLHTFLLETERDAAPHDKDSLVTVRKGPKTIIRHLLSADTKEERLEWCTKLNSALSTLHCNTRT